jgi:cytochrome P450
VDIPHATALQRLQHFFTVFHSSQHDRWLVLREATGRDLLRSGALRKSDAKATASTRFTSPALQLFHEHNVLYADPPKHSRLRRVLRSLYPAQDVASLDAMISTLLDELLDSIDPSVEVDLFEAVAFPLPVRVIGELIGIPNELLGTFLRWSVVATAIAEPDATGPGFDDAEDNAQVAFDTARTCLVDGVGLEGSFFGRLREAVAAGAVSEDEACSLVLMTFSAGHETTSSLIGSCVLALADDPDLQEVVRADGAARRCFVQEVVRLCSPVQYAEYSLSRAVDVGPNRLDEGECVAVLFGAANRDPDAFPEPDALDLRRPEVASHLAFGAGRHACPGGALATQEAELAVAAVLDRWDLQIGGSGAQWSPRQFLSGPTAIPCRLVDRANRRAR